MQPPPKPFKLIAPEELTQQELNELWALPQKHPPVPPPLKVVVSTGTQTR